MVSRSPSRRWSRPPRRRPQGALPGALPVPLSAASPAHLHRARHRAPPLRGRYPAPLPARAACASRVLLRSWTLPAAVAASGSDPLVGALLLLVGHHLAAVLAARLVARGGDAAVSAQVVRHAALDAFVPYDGAVVRSSQPAHSRPARSPARARTACTGRLPPRGGHAAAFWRLCFVQTAQTVLPLGTGRRKHVWHFHAFFASLRCRCMYPRRWTRLATVRG
jgi:hypothetical protein